MTKNNDFFSLDDYKKPATIDSPGWYILEVIGVQRIRVPSGTEGFEFRFRVIVGPSAGAELREIFWDTPKALWRLAAFTRLFYSGNGFHRSDAKALWSIYAGARVSAEVALKSRDADSPAYPEIKRFVRIPESEQPRLAVIPRVAAMQPPEGIAVPKPLAKSSERTEKEHGPQKFGGSYASGAGDSDDDDIPF